MSSPTEFKNVKYTPLFKKQLKDYHRNEQKIIDLRIQELLKNPDDGEDLVGDVLRGCKSIRISNQIPGSCRLIYHIAHREREDRYIHLIAVGPHRTIYVEAERYVRETGILKSSL